MAVSRQAVAHSRACAVQDIVSMAFSADGHLLAVQGGAPDWLLVIWVWEKAKTVDSLKITASAATATPVVQAWALSLRAPHAHASVRTALSGQPSTVRSAQHTAWHATCGIGGGAASPGYIMLTSKCRPSAMLRSCATAAGAVRAAAGVRWQHATQRGGPREIQGVQSGRPLRAQAPHSRPGAPQLPELHLPSVAG